MPPTTIGDLRERRELTQKAMAKLLGCNPSFVNIKIDKGLIAPNHPLVPKLAQALGMTVPELQVLCKGAEMTPGQLSLSKLHLGKPSPRTVADGKRPKKKKKGSSGGGSNGGIEGWWTRRAREKRAARDDKRESKHLVRVPKVAVAGFGKGWKAQRDANVAAAEKARSDGKPGTALATRRAKRAYNALRLMDEETRQSARSLAMATVLAAMNGQKYLDVAIPTIGMATILNDWFRLKGIPEPVVTTVDFEEIFG